MTIEEYQDALKELYAARDYFNVVDPERIDIAIHRLIAAEMRVDQAIKDVKRLVDAG